MIKLSSLRSPRVIAAGLTVRARSYYISMPRGRGGEEELVIYEGNTGQALNRVEAGRLHAWLGKWISAYDSAEAAHAAREAAEAE